MSKEDISQYPLWDQKPGICPVCGKKTAPIGNGKFRIYCSLECQQTEKKRREHLKVIGELPAKFRKKCIECGKEYAVATNKAHLVTICDECAGIKYGLDYVDKKPREMTDVALLEQRRMKKGGFGQRVCHICHKPSKGQYWCDSCKRKRHLCEYATSMSDTGGSDFTGATVHRGSRIHEDDLF